MMMMTESNDSTVTLMQSFVTSTVVLPGNLAGEKLTRRDALWEVEEVERVLAPLTVALTAVSNVTLLVHETRVVWLTRTLIPPKLLVLSLCSADLLATLTGFLPLWLYFVVPQDARGTPGTTSTTQTWSSTANPHSSPSPASATTTRVPDSSSHSTTPFPDPPGGPTDGGDPLLHSAGYSATLFLLTTFWTLAQCIVVLMGVERFLALRAPFFYTARCSSPAFIAALGLLSLVSGGVGAFHLLVHRQELEEHPVVFAGFLDSRSLAHNVFTLTQGLVWTVVLLMCNWAVTRELRRMECRVTVMRMKDQSEYLKQLSLVHGAGREFARFMMAVNIVFLLSSLPNLVSCFLNE